MTAARLRALAKTVSREIRVGRGRAPARACAARGSPYATRARACELSRLVSRGSARHVRAEHAGSASRVLRLRHATDSWRSGPLLGRLRGAARRASGRRPRLPHARVARPDRPRRPLDQRATAKRAPETPAATARPSVSAPTRGRARRHVIGRDRSRREPRHRARRRRRRRRGGGDARRARRRRRRVGRERRRATRRRGRRRPSPSDAARRGRRRARDATSDGRRASAAVAE